MTSKISPLIKPTQVAHDMLCWLLKRDTSGCFAEVSGAEIQKNFPALTKAALNSALAQLEGRGLIASRSLAGMPNACIRATLEATLQFGKHATGHDIDADAVAIARSWLQEPALRHVPRLYDRFDWDLRRLNPPLLLIRSLLDPTLFTPSRSPAYAFERVTLTAEATARLESWSANATLLDAPAAAPARVKVG